MSSHISNERPAADKVLADIADYALDYWIESELAYSTARACLIDTLGCGLEALEYPACTKLLGPIVPGTTVPNGARVPGTPYQLDPVLAAFNIGAMIRWLDFNDTWLAAEWGHPSDNLGGILATADWLSRTAIAEGKTPLTMRRVLTAMIKAHEIQGCIALENSFNKVGLDHVVLVKVASTAVVCELLGLSREQTIAALSLAWVDGQSLRTYRHAPNTGSRKSWAAGDATSRAVSLALMAKAGEMGYPSVLTAKTWGFYDVSFRGQEFRFQRPYGSYVMENVLFKISYPAEFHAQTAVEAAVTLHAQLAARGLNASAIRSINLRTHEACLRIIDKKGPLANPADRDHCVQYMIAVPLIFGRLTAADYEDSAARCGGRALTPCANPSPAWKSRSSRVTITTRTSARLPTRCVWSCVMERCWKRPSSIRLGIGGAARKACRCCWRSSRPTCGDATRRTGSSAFLRLRSTATGSTACR